MTQNLKKYIILTPSVGDMGGAQMYTANKVEYLKENGWDVAVYYCLPYKKLLIEELKAFDENFLPDMQYGIQYLPKTRKRKVLDTICQETSNYKETVIETHLVSLAVWGEMIAKRIEGRHVINFLEEHPHALSRREADYYEFKLKRREILNASEFSLKRLFGGFYKEGYSQFEHKSDFFCSNVVSDAGFDNSSVKKADFNLLSIGRLDKPYIETLVLELKKFAQKNIKYSFNIHFVGGSNSGTVEKWIEQELGSMENVNLYLYGFVYPIPSGLIDITDIAIASANSILVTSERGCPTISIDMTDFGGIGVFGYTTENKFNRTTEPFIPVSELLEQVLINKTLVVNKKEKSTQRSAKSKKLMEENVSYIKCMDAKKEYFDEKRIYSAKERLYCQLKWFIHNYFGVQREKKG